MSIMLSLYFVVTNMILLCFLLDVMYFGTADIAPKTCIAYCQIESL